jgi:sulfate adenylyltransferase
MSGTLKREGFTVFFTGLPAAGKSTLAAALERALRDADGRAITMLDGDAVRRHLSSELGYSKEHRDLNIRRIGFVAGEVTKAGGIALCAAIAPYDAVRKEVRAMVQEHGGFVLVYVATPAEVCERRDPKGLWAKARAGAVQGFTGVSDPYEPPDDAELVFDTTDLSPEDAAGMVIQRLRDDGYLEDVVG